MPRRTPAFTQLLSPAERREYAELLTEAGYDEHGRRRPSDEIGERTHMLLLDALQAGRQWAGWALEQDARAGHLARFKAWTKRKELVPMPDGERIVPRSALLGVTFVDPETGERRWRMEKLEEMDRGQVMEVLACAERRVNSNRVIANSGRRLIGLLDATGKEKVSDALTAAGMTLAEALNPPQSQAA